MRVSVLGMGRMGSAIAGRLAEGGHDLTVWNRSEGKAGAAVAAGAREASSLAEAVRGAEVVISMLADDGAVRSIALGDDGLRSMLPDGVVYVDCSTISPELALELGEAFPRYAAMPVMGSPEAVRSGMATLVVGADSETATAIESVVTSISGTVRYLDRPALALTAKVTGNFLLLAGLVTLAEAFAVARAGGLTDEEIRALLADNPLVPPALRNRFDAVLDGSPEGWFAIPLGGKDVGLAVALAAGAGVSLRAGDAVRSAYEAAADAGLSDADVAAVGTIYRA